MGWKHYQPGRVKRRQNVKTAFTFIRTLTTVHDRSLEMLDAVTLSIQHKLSKIGLKLDLARKAHK